MTSSRTVDSGPGSTTSTLTADRNRVLLSSGITSWGLGQLAATHQLHRLLGQLPKLEGVARNGQPSKDVHHEDRDEEALTLLKDTNRKYPDRPQVWAAIVRNEMKLGRAEEAIRWLTKYNAVQGRQAWGYERLGRAYAESGNPGGAEKAFRQALEVDPKTILCQLWLGQLLMAEGREEEAKIYFADYRRLMRFKRLERHYEMALLKNPQDLEALSHLALYRHHLGKNKEAWIPLQKALEIAPQHPDLLRLKGMIVPELK